MKEKGRRLLWIGCVFIAVFAIWTLLIQKVDVQPLGVNGTNIGFATINCWFHKLTGVHMAIYIITDWLGLVPIFICMIFGAIGCTQFIKRRSLLKSFPENLRYETEQGDMVRSKSEVIIANLLYRNKTDIIYKYEKPLEVIENGRKKTIYPDFTIMNVHTGKVTYWEHAGIMDDAFYANEFVKKMNLYITNGLMPGKDVVVTFESQGNPLDIRVVKRLVKEIILGEDILE